ncbi:MAG: PAS domain S-box protein [candidate division Zixibacteria bacterium]|nr:PAS domain S-box protein [candidate division Zixibacteria bacterium]
MISESHTESRIFCHLYDSQENRNRQCSEYIASQIDSEREICILKNSRSEGTNLDSILRNISSSYGKLLARKLQLISIGNQPENMIRETVERICLNNRQARYSKSKSLILQDLPADLEGYILTKIKYSADRSPVKSILIQHDHKDCSSREIDLILKNCNYIIHNNDLLHNRFRGCDLEAVVAHLDLEKLRSLLWWTNTGRQIDFFNTRQAVDFEALENSTEPAVALLKNNTVISLNSRAKQLLRECFSNGENPARDLDHIIKQFEKSLGDSLPADFASNRKFTVTPDSDSCLKVETMPVLKDRDDLIILSMEPAKSSKPRQSNRQLSLHKDFSPIKVPERFQENATDLRFVKPSRTYIEDFLEHRSKPKSPGSSKENVSNILFEVLTEKALVGIYLVQDELFCYVNPRFAEIFGYTREEIENRLGIAELAHPDDIPKIQENIRRRIQGEVDTLHYTFRGNTKQGQSIQVEVFGSRTTYNNRPAVSGTLLDITTSHRRQITQSLIYDFEREIHLSDDPEELFRRVHRQLKKLFNLSNFYVALYDPHRRRYSFPYFADQYDKASEISAEQMRYSLTDYVRRTAKPLYADTKNQEKLMAQGEIRLVGTKAPLWIGAPLIEEGRVLGVIALQSYDPRQYSSPDDLKLLSVLAKRIATAMVYQKTQVELDQSRKKFANIIAKIPGCAYSYRLDDQFSIEFLSPGASKIFGISSDYLVESKKISYLNLVNEEDRQDLLKKLRQARDRHGQFETEYRIRTTGQEVRWVHDFATVRQDDEQCCVVEGFLYDISDQKQQQQESIKTHKLLVAALESSPAGVMIADAPDVNIVLANSAALEIRGPTPLALTNIHVSLHPKRWQTYFPDGTICFPEELPLSRAILFGETVADMEIIIRRDSGEERWVSFSAAPVYDQNGKIVAGVAVFPDITERKAMERELKKTNFKLQSERFNLREKNIALRELLNQIDREKMTIERQIQTNLDTVVLPLLHSLREKIHPEEYPMTVALEKALQKVVSPFVNKLRNTFSHLTPRELEICSLIRQGLTSKEISSILSLSDQTIHQQRKIIRRKLGLTNTETNLTSYLNSNYDSGAEA